MSKHYETAPADTATLAHDQHRPERRRLAAARPNADRGRRSADAARLRDLLMVLGYTPEALLFAGSIAQAKALLADQPIAMALVDVGLPDGNGVDLIRVLHQRDATLPILVISTWNTEQVVVTALQAGATGYLLKERDDAEISLSIRSALRGGAPIDPFVAKRILELIGTGDAAGKSSAHGIAGRWRVTVERA